MNLWTSGFFAVLLSFVPDYDRLHFCPKDLQLKYVMSLLKFSMPFPSSKQNISWLRLENELKLMKIASFQPMNNPKCWHTEVGRMY